MHNNIISQRLVVLESLMETNTTQNNTKIFIESNSILCIEEFSNVLAHYGYFLKNDLYMEILFLISHTTKVEHLMAFFKELQMLISPHTTCMFNFEITKKEHCITEVILK